MEEAGFSETPGPDYKVIETSVFKRRNMSVKFQSMKTDRLTPIKKLDSQDFYETEKALKYALANSAIIGFSKSPKKSFAEECAKRSLKNPGVGTYKISDRAYKMLSTSPTARRR